MKEFLSSRNVSLGCTVINAVCAAIAAFNGSWIWFGVSTGLAALCYNNYRKG
jgi:ABC-type glycerol-3-phosphate transport system permease component